MIELDLHVHNDMSVDWKTTLLTAAERRDFLEEQAREHEAQTGKYIRPICLIQVERTGKNQRDGKHIHAEEVREYLHKLVRNAADKHYWTSAVHVNDVLLRYTGLPRTYGVTVTYRFE